MTPDSESESDYTELQMTVKMMRTMCCRLQGMSLTEVVEAMTVTQLEQVTLHLHLHLLNVKLPHMLETQVGTPPLASLHQEKIYLRGK